MSCVDRCPGCPGDYLPIPGDGPVPCRVMILGERPGKDENRESRVFIGKTGQELNETYLPLARLARQQVRVCNAVRCWADNNRTPTDKEVQVCAGHHLPGELAAGQPDVVLLMGGSACRLVPGIDLETHHGRPRTATLYGWTGTVIPLYHPAIGLHEGRWMTTLLEDWEEVGRFLGTGRVSVPDRDVPRTDYRLAQPVDVVPIIPGQTVAVDTESHGPDFWSLQWSLRPGHGRMVLAGDRSFPLYIDWLKRAGEIIYHHAVADQDPLEKIDPALARIPWRDTMQEAFHQGNLPQGLKTLVYRLFGVTMTSWKDVVWPYSIQAVREWMLEAKWVAAADLSYEEKIPYTSKAAKYAGRSKIKVHKGSLEKMLDRLLANTMDETDYDPWKNKDKKEDAAPRLDEFWREPANEWMVNHVEARVGRYPILGIGNAPLDRAVEYGCGDSDWTLQVAGELARRRDSGLFRVAEGDRDK